MNAAHRLVVPAVIALAIAVASPLFWLWPDDGVVDRWTVGVALWQILPFAVLLLFRGIGFSQIGTVVTALALAVLTVLGYVAIERSDSSTAGIALYFFPIYLAVGVVIAFFFDLGIRRIGRHFEHRSARGVG